MSVKKLQNTTKWTAGAWLGVVTNPLDGVEHSGDPPIPTILTNHVESLWGFVVLVVAVFEERGRYKLSGEKAFESCRWRGVNKKILATFWCRFTKFADVLQACGSFAFENGRRIWIPQNNNQAQMDMTEAPATGYRTCKGHAAVGKKHWFLPAHTTSEGARREGRNRWRRGVVRQEEDGAVEMALGKKIEWDAIWAAWKRLSREDPRECSYALATMSWSAGTRASYAGHIKAFGAFAVVQPGLGLEKLLERYIRSIFAKG